MNRLFILVSLVFSFSSMAQTLWDQRNNEIDAQMSEEYTRSTAASNAKFMAHLAQQVAACTKDPNVVYAGKAEKRGWSSFNYPSFNAGEWSCMVAYRSTNYYPNPKITCVNGQQNFISCPYKTARLGGGPI